MKKIVGVLVLLLSFFTYSQDMYFSHDQSIDLKLELLETKSKTYQTYKTESNFPLGPAIMLGGSSFILAGVLTTPIYVGGSTTVKQPFFKQGGRMLAIMTGLTLTTVGVVITIGN